MEHRTNQAASNLSGLFLFSLYEHQAADLGVGEREIRQAQALDRLRPSGRLSAAGGEQASDPLAQRVTRLPAGFRRRRWRRDHGLIRRDRKTRGVVVHLSVRNEVSVVDDGGLRRWWRRSGARCRHAARPA